MDLSRWSFVGLAVLSPVLLVVMLMVIASLFGRYRGPRAVLRPSTSYAQDNLALHAGETLVGVVELQKGTSFFLTLNTTTSTPYE